LQLKPQSKQHWEKKKLKKKYFFQFQVSSKKLSSAKQQKDQWERQILSFLFYIIFTCRFE
jgi:hypothetical protein